MAFETFIMHLVTAQTNYVLSEPDLEKRNQKAEYITEFIKEAAKEAFPCVDLIELYETVFKKLVQIREENHKSWR